jgi:hypothetical protein
MSIMHAMRCVALRALHWDMEMFRLSYFFLSAHRTAGVGLVAFARRKAFWDWIRQSKR